MSPEELVLMMFGKSIMLAEKIELHKTKKKTKKRNEKIKKLKSKLQRELKQTYVFLEDRYKELLRTIHHTDTDKLEQAMINLTNIINGINNDEDRFSVNLTKEKDKMIELRLDYYRKHKLND